ncbi:hypothetical protein [Maritalea sp.]|jgi:hypothetical protein|uniref:hypothetical protein n=1 Tax=Maritalea sp. TaxID=2003361 RepID=UPI0039E5EE91
MIVLSILAVKVEGAELPRLKVGVSEFVSFVDAFFAPFENKGTRPDDGGST